MTKVTRNMEAEVRYGQRLVPQIIDESASHDPTRLIGMMATSADISKGFTKVTIGDVARAINFMAFWLDENLARHSEFETVAFLASTQSSYISHNWTDRNPGLQ